MFAGVKFQCDKTVCIVSINQIKNFKPPLDGSKVYQVFWSLNPDDSPDNASTNVDKLYKIHKSKSQQTNIPAPSGYFNAKILCTADTFEETKRSLESLGFALDGNTPVQSTLQRYSKSAAAKMRYSAASSTIKSAMLKNSLVFTDDSDVDETVEPVKQYTERIGLLESANGKLEITVEALKLELDLMKEKSAKLEEDNNFLSDKLDKTKTKYRALKAEFKTARGLNYDLQRKLINSLNINLDISTSNSIPDLESQPSSPSLLSSIYHKKRSSNSIASYPPPKISKISLNTANILPTEENSQNEAFSTPLLSTVEDDDDNFKLTNETIKSSGLGCRYGKDGDKVFVKNLAINLFGKETLRNSSVTGRKPPTGGKPPRPSLPKAGIAYIQHVLNKRVANELSTNINLDLTEDAKRAIVNERASSVIVVEAIGDKIATLRRIKK